MSTQISYSTLFTAGVPFWLVCTATFTVWATCQHDLRAILAVDLANSRAAKEQTETPPVEQKRFRTLSTKMSWCVKDSVRLVGGGRRTAGEVRVGQSAFHLLRLFTNSSSFTGFHCWLMVMSCKGVRKKMDHDSRFEFDRLIVLADFCSHSNVSRLCETLLEVLCQIYMTFIGTLRDFCEPL